MGLIRALMVALLLHSAQVILCHPIPHNDTDECSTVSSRSMIREVSTRMRDLISGVYLMPTKEVDGNFSKYVCPMFKEYSQLYVTRESYLDKNDSLYSNLSLVMFAAEKVLRDSCQYAIQFVNDSTVNCSSIYSISQYCYDANQMQMNISSFFEPFKYETLYPPENHAVCWLTELISANLPDWNESMQNTLLFVLQTKRSMRCTVSINEIHATVNATCCKCTNAACTNCV